MLDKAIQLAANKFVSVFDKGGNPYILHCLYVMNQVSPDKDLMIAVVLHDIVEDTDVTIKDLYNYGYESNVIEIILLLTKKKEESYQTYIERIATHPGAARIKLADLRHNSDITRLKGLTKKDFDRLKKYAEAYTYLSQL